MNTDKLILASQNFLLAFYLSCWFSIILPELVSGGIINFVMVGFCGSLMLIVISGISYLHIRVPKWSIFLAAFFTLILISATFIISDLNITMVFIICLFTCLLHGFLLGLHLKANLTTGSFYKSLPLFLLGAVIAILTSILGYGMSIKKVPAASGMVSADIDMLPMVLMSGSIIVFMILLYFKSFHISNDADQENKSPLYPLPIRGIIIILSGTFCLFELMFIFWSLVLQNDHQGIISRLTFPVSLIVVFIFRAFLSNLIKVFSNAGWIFFLAVLITISTGLFYTFDFTPLFILGFGCSISYLILAHSRLYSIHWDGKIISFVLLAGAVSMFIAGLYVQNHIEFIRLIKMPDDVILLSARQALVKEMASFLGIAVVLTGYLFLKRRALIQIHNEIV